MLTKTKKWKEFYLKDICRITMGNKMDFSKMSFDDPTVSFIGRSDKDNGVAGLVDIAYDSAGKKIEPYKAGAVTVALGGTLGASFVQNKDFYTSQNVAVLEFGKTVSLLAKLFITSVIMFECRYKYYPFGRELNTHIRNDFTLELPVNKDDKPDWGYMEDYMKSLHHQPLYTDKKHSNMSLEMARWSEFRIGDLFPNMKRGKVHNQDDELNNGDDLYYVGAKLADNGIMRKVAYDAEYVFEGNCIVFICNGEGSVGYAFYQDREFAPSGDLKIGYNPNLNQYNGVFIATLLCLERPRYSFGRKWGSYVEDTMIKLPAKENGMPDWEWMEQYIKSLPMAEFLPGLKKQQNVQYEQIVLEITPGMEDLPKVAEEKFKYE